MIGASTPFLIRLPQEILDEILSEVDLHRDLVSFASVSKACFRLAIPRHTEYRVLRVRHKMPAMWAHLARRADLTRNIREVHLCERHNQASSDRYPSSLVRTASMATVVLEDENVRVRDVCTALRHMERLRAFTWSSDKLPFPEPTVTPAQESEILSTLVGKPDLKHVALAGGFEAFPGRHNSIYPLWKLSNLQQLSLSGRVWYKPTLGPLVKLMLKSSPTLESLRVPMEMTVISDLVLPALKTVKIVMESGGTVSLDKSWLNFLENNKTLEDVSWFPIGDLPAGISAKALPALKRVHAGERFLRALYESPRQIEAIDTTLQPAALVDLKGFESGTLRSATLNCVSADVVDSLRALGEMCPELHHLSLPNVALPVDTWLEVFSHFPKLEVYAGPSLWNAVKGDMDQMHVVIMRMISRCPNLKQLDHLKYDYKRRDFNKIVMVREGESGEHVRYEIRRAPPKNPMTTMM